MVIIFAIAIETFTQQITQLETGPSAMDPSCDTPGMQVAWFLEEFRAWALTDQFYSNLLSPGPSRLQPYCPTADCVWDPYQTLATCTQCTDISELINVSNSCFMDTSSPCSAYLPNGLTFDCWRSLQEYGWRGGADVRSDINATTTGGPLLKIEALGLSIFNYTVMNKIGDPGRQMPFNKRYCSSNWTRERTDQGISDCTFELYKHLKATECTFYWCIKSFSAQTKNGSFTETLMDSWWTTQELDHHHHQTSQNRPEYLISTHDSGKSTTTHSRESGRLIKNPDALSARWANYQVSRTCSPCYVSVLAHESMNTYLPVIMNSTLFANLVENVPVNHAFFNYSSFWDGQFDPIPNIFSTFAMTVENLIRRADLHLPSSDPKVKGYDLEDRRNLVNGTAFESRIFVRVRWGWLAYPIGLVAMTTVVTLWTRFTTTKHQLPLWGSSTLALMLSGSEETRPRTHPAEPLNAFAKRIDVSLHSDSQDEWVLIRRPVRDTADSIALEHMNSNMLIPQDFPPVPPPSSIYYGNPGSSTYSLTQKKRRLENMTPSDQAPRNEISRSQFI